ncbi:hypothetical protein PMM47T1_26827 [Pseudomonas sp. M47T1]|uniref:hypothetical protein n=1 Tax=Pseudomonas sp. M47T1 TaxID=1179778 RepID=UPI00026080FF|nr:hypothetical protein [Pseudomonas sp. M47T1]EIK93476.1 hypothetical protein PMM47T1_26827 [Pseudomonas sp. M47T1]
MDLSLGTAYSTTSTLSVSEQPLNAQPLATDAAQTLQAAAAGPAAVYHPSDEAQALGLTMEAVTTWIGRPQSADFPQKAAVQQVAQAALKSAFQSFQSTLTSAFPALGEKKFGFTVLADGSLKATNSAGQLSATDISRLNTLLNGDSDLKTAASDFRDASIDVVIADSPWSGSYLGGYNLTKDNFASTIDLGALFTPRGPVPTKEYIQGLFFNQLYTKGERLTEQTEAVLMASGTQG